MLVCKVLKVKKAKEVKKQRSELYLIVALNVSFCRMKIFELALAYNYKQVFMVAGGQKLFPSFQL